MRSQIRLAVLSGIAVLFLVFVQGCAAGRGPDGSVIVGIDVAKLPETASEAFNAAAGFLPAPWNYVATGAVGLLGGGIAAVRERARRNGERAGWDERGREVVDTPSGPASVAPVPPVSHPGNVAQPPVA